MKPWILTSFFLSLLIANSLFAIEKQITSPDWVKDRLLYEVNVRQFSQEGTFKEVEKKLPLLKELGVGILWLMPIQEIGIEKRKGTLGSYYSIKDYTSINPEFGTSSDLHDLIEKAHELKVKVILDWVANHTAWDHHWTKTNPDFYNRNAWGDFIPPADGWDDVIDLNYDNSLLHGEMIDEMKYWITEFDIDGFRFDVASMVPTSFWESARAELSKVKEIFMLGETDLNDVLEKSLDAVYGHHLYDSFVNLVHGKRNATDVWNTIVGDLFLYPYGSIVMNYATNHDKNSWVGHLTERVGEASQLFTVLSFIAPGMPLVYNGQEAGLNKRLKFFERDPIQWQPHYQFHLIKMLARLKQNSAALHTGDEPAATYRIVTSNDQNILAIHRFKNGEEVVALLNLSPNAHWFDVNNQKLNEPYYDLLSDEMINFQSNSRFHLHPWGYRIFHNAKLEK